jgi:hypothetical protein
MKKSMQYVAWFEMENEELKLTKKHIVRKTKHHYIRSSVYFCFHLRVR